MDVLQTRINEDVYDRLSSANIDSLKQILTTNERDLRQCTKLSSEEIKSVVHEAASLVIQEKFTSVSRMSDWARITTGCPSIDAITRGGVPTQGLSEIFGPSGAGKTQLCVQLAITVQFPPTLGGLNKGAIFICTEDRFPTKRLQELAANVVTKYGNPDLARVNFEKNIFLEHVPDYEQLRRCISVRLPNFLKQKEIGLIVIDSIAGAFRSENLDVDYTTRSNELNSVAQSLKELSEKFQLAVVCTNQVTDNPNTSTFEPCLGLAWGNLVTYRFAVEKFGAHREFRVVFAPDLSVRSCTFSVDRSGVCS